MTNQTPGRPLVLGEAGFFRFSTPTAGERGAQIDSRTMTTFELHAALAQLDRLEDQLERALARRLAREAMTATATAGVH